MSVPSPWESLDPSAREAVADTLSRLLHDWIKAMEMWLLSVDWTDPPPDAPTLLQRAVRQTRRRADGSRSARQMWEEARDDLPASAAWKAALDAELNAIEALCELDLDALRELGAQVEDRVRAPGQRLRQARAELQP